MNQVQSKSKNLQTIPQKPIQNRPTRRLAIFESHIALSRDCKNTLFLNS